MLLSMHDTCIWKGSPHMKKAKLNSTVFMSLIGFFVIILGATVLLTSKNTRDLQRILEDSVRAQLISTSIAARGIIDIDRFDSYNRREDVDRDKEAYSQTLAELRSLQQEVGAEYIYALKHIDGKDVFIFDTDTEENTLFEGYEIFSVHEQAFYGHESADIMNVTDEWGSFNTGAVPIWKGGDVLGIISTDIRDTYVAESASMARVNIIALILTLSVTMSIIIVIVIVLLRRVRKSQDELFHMANIDALTGLPNRHYLMQYLAQVAEKAVKNDEPFALLLIDLDNFKAVNDSAGHDAGDELLRHIASYLNEIHEASTCFRPTAGKLSVSARIGGDEFIQIVPGISSVHEAELIAQKLLDNFSSQAIDRYIEKYQVGLSIGVTLFPLHTSDIGVLIKYADIAMYHAKKSTKNTYRIYSDDMQDGNEGSDVEGTNDRRRYRK